MREWDAYAAEWYTERYGEYATNRLAVDRIELKPTTDILDVGCGTGAALRHASQVVTHGKLIGVDLVPRMVEIAQERAAGHPAEHRLDFRVGRADALPVEDSCADVVLAFDTFDHWSSPSDGLAEVLRVLRPGGRFCVVKDGSEPQRLPFAELAETAGFTIDTHEHIEGEGITFLFWVCRVASR